MAKYTDEFGNITEVGNPDLNPSLIKGKTQVPDNTPFKNSTIPISTLTSTANPLNVQTPTPTIAPDISKLNTSVPEMKATALEIQANDLTASLQAINDKLTGQSAFRSTQEAKQGLPELLKTQTDLSARLKGLQNEALSIPLQLQQGAEGRGITAGGLAPIQAGALRENSIKALSISSMLEASRGNITLANDLVDKAVNAQYAPLLEEQKAKLANLDLILKSPAYSLADKNRANAQKVLDKATQNQVEQAQKDKDEILKNIAIPAAQNAANFVSDGTPAHATLALTFDAISKAKTPQEALQIATANGLTTKKEPGFELSPGQQRYDAKGNLIASVPEKPNYDFQTITTEDAFGNKTQRVVAYDKNTGKQVGEVGKNGGLTSLPNEKIVEANGKIDTSLLAKYTPDQQREITAYANQYASEGKIPPGMPKGLFGVVAQIAKEMPKQKGQILDGATGISPAGETTLSNAMSNIYSAVELAKQLKELDKKRITGLTSALVGKIFGSADQRRYVDLKNQIVDLLARARTGAAMTTSEEEFYGSMLPGRIGQIGFGILGTNTGVRIDNFINNLSDDLRNKASAKGWVVNNLSKINLGGKEYQVGQEIEVNGVRGRILPDGKIVTQ